MRLVFHPKVYSDIDEIMGYYERVATRKLADKFYSELRCYMQQRWLDPGTFVSSIVNSDKVLRRRDLDDESFRRAATIVVSTRDQIRNDEPIWLTDGIESGAVSWNRIGRSASWCAGKSPRRKDDSEITILENNGLSVQFANVGAAVMQRAKERGLGRQLAIHVRAGLSHLADTSRRLPAVFGNLRGEPGKNPRAGISLAQNGLGLAGFRPLLPSLHAAEQSQGVRHSVAPHQLESCLEEPPGFGLDERKRRSWCCPLTVQENPDQLSSRNEKFCRSFYPSRPTRRGHRAKKCPFIDQVETLPEIVSEEVAQHHPVRQSPEHSFCLIDGSRRKI